MEIWKDIMGFEDRYQISNLGNLRSVDRLANHAKGGKRLIKGKKMKIFAIPRGYIFARLYDGNKSINRYIHRLVGQHFIPNPDNLPQINHKNGIKSDNRVENLEWCTMSHNIRHSYRELGQINSMQGKTGSLSPRAKRVFCITNGKYYGSSLEATRELDLPVGKVSAVCLGDRPHTKGYKFIYA